MQKIKRKSPLFTDLKRGLNFGKKYYKIQYFLDLIMEASKDQFDLESLVFVFQNDYIESFFLSHNRFLTNDLFNFKFDYYRKQTIFDLNSFSKKINKVVFYFSLNSWNELNLEIYQQGEEFDYKKYYAFSSKFDFLYKENFVILSNHDYSKKQSKYSLFNLQNFEQDDLTQVLKKIDLNQKILITFLNYRELIDSKLITDLELDGIKLNFLEAKEELSESNLFQKSIKLANKNNINTIVLFDDGFKSFRIAYKVNNIWIFLDADKQSAIFMHYLMKHFQVKPNIFLDYEMSNYLQTIIKSFHKDFSTTVDPFVAFSDQKFIYINDNYYFYQQIFASNLDLIISFLNKYSIVEYLSALEQNYGYEEFKIIEKSLNLEKWNHLEQDILETTNIFEQQAKVDKIIENDELIIYKIESKDSKVIIKYYKLDQWIYLDLSLKGDDKLYLLEKLVKTQKDFKKANTFGNKDYFELETKKGLVKLFAIILIFLGLLFFTFYSIIGFDNTSDALTIFFQSYRNINFWVLFLNVIIGPAIATLPFWYIFKKSNTNIKFSVMLIAIYISKFLATITPFSYLPFIASIWYLKKQNLKSYQVVSGIFLTLLITELFGVFANGISLVYGLVVYNDISGGENIGLISGISFFGILWSTMLFFFFLTLVASPRTHAGFLGMLRRITFAFGANEWYDNTYSNLEYNLSLIRSSLKQMATHPKNLIVMALIYFVFYFWWELILYSSIMIIGPNVSDFTFDKSIGFDTIIWEMNIWIPIPGKTGVTEAIGSNILNNALGWTATPEKGNQAIFLYRFFGTYVYATVAGFIFFFFLIKNTLQKH